MPQYQIINQLPSVPYNKPGKTIWLCQDCLDHSYINEPHFHNKKVTVCPKCKDAAICREYEKKRLIPMPVRKRIQKISIREQFNIVSR